MEQIHETSSYSDPTIGSDCGRKMYMREHSRIIFKRSTRANPFLEIHSV